MLKLNSRFSEKVRQYVAQALPCHAVDSASAPQSVWQENVKKAARHWRRDLLHAHHLGDRHLQAV